MSWFNFVSCRPFQSFQLEIFFVIFIVEFINWASEFSLEGLKVLFELFRHNKYWGLLVEIISSMLFNSFNSISSYDSFVCWLDLAAEIKIIGFSACLSTSSSCRASLSINKCVFAPVYLFLHPYLYFFTIFCL